MESSLAFLNAYQASGGRHYRMSEKGVPYVIINQGATDHDMSPHVTLRIDGDVGQVFSSAVSQTLST